VYLKRKIEEIVGADGLGGQGNFVFARFWAARKDKVL